MHDTRVQAVVTAGETLISKEHPQSADIRTKVDGLAVDRQALTDAFTARHKEVNTATCCRKLSRRAHPKGPSSLAPFHGRSMTMV